MVKEHVNVCMTVLCVCKCVRVCVRLVLSPWDEFNSMILILALQLMSMSPLFLFTFFFLLLIDHIRFGQQELRT